MKKLLVFLVVLTIGATLTGCTVDDYKANREQLKIDCKADVECWNFMVEDADELIKETPVYKALEQRMTDAELLIVTLQTETAELQTQLTAKGVEIADIQAQLLTATTERATLQGQLDTLQTEYDTLKAQVDNNTQVLTELEYRVKLLESVVYGGDGATQVYVSGVFGNAITVYTTEEDGITIIHIPLQSVIDSGYNGEMVKTNLLSFLALDLAQVIEPETIKIVFYQDSTDDDVYNLIDLLAE